MKNITGIYQIQSKINPNRIYIGSAISTTLRRNSHLFYLRKNNHQSVKLQRHYNKYGETDLTFSILLGCEEDDLIKIEQYFIDLYKPYFNSSANAKNTMLGRFHTEETKKKISDKKRGQPSSRKGKTLSEEHKNNMRHPHKHFWTEEGKKRKILSLIGNKNACGKRSEEAKQKMRKPHGPMLEETKLKMSKLKMGHPNYYHGKKLLK